MVEIDPRDAVLQAHAPTIMMPRFSAITGLDHSGHRYLVAQDGLWIEVRRPWLQLLWPFAPSPAPLPYGALEDTMEFGFEWDAFWVLVEQFRREACNALPNEHAAWFVWDEHAGRLFYRRLIAIDAGPAGIKLHRPQLAAHEHLAVDIHSHGTLPAGFSGTDDADDAGEVKLSVVLGNLDDPGAETQSMRLCAHGLFIPFADKSEAVCRVCGCTDSTPCEGGCAWVEPDLCSACAFAEKP
jgi:PRTRC genetic system protein A